MRSRTGTRFGSSRRGALRRMRRYGTTRRHSASQSAEEDGVANGSIKARAKTKTSGHDWVGAAVFGPGEMPARRRRGRKLHIWRSPKRPELYLITGREITSDLPAPLAQIAWQHFKTITESGRPRIGFSEAKAKQDIETQGFHLVRVTLNTTKRVGPPYGRLMRRRKAPANRGVA